MDKNFMPLPYRQVSVQKYTGAWTEEALKNHLLGRDAYRRTAYIILYDENNKSSCGIVRIEKESEEPLFSPITKVEILAGPELCVWVEDAAIDVGNRSAMAEKALSLNISLEKTLIVRGKFEHTNFIHRPDPLRVQVFDLVPPEPSKLYEMAKTVLEYAELPAIHLEYIPIRLEHLAAQAPEAESFLIPCRASSLKLNKPVYFLDEHPELQNWVMIGCDRSLQIHRHFYGHDPKRIEMCPKKLKGNESSPTLVKCCMLENHAEVVDNFAVVPWGAKLKHVEEALRTLAEKYVPDEAGGNK